MKRPLTGLCILFLVFILMIQTVERQPQDAPLLQTEQLLSDLEEEGAVITAAGIVTECSTISSGVRLFMNHLTIYSKNNSEISLLPEQKIAFTAKDTEVCPGDYVQVTGFCTLFEAAANPGQFDSRAYYFAKNTVCMLKEARIQQVRQGGYSLARVLYRIRTAFSSSFDQILDEKSAGTIAAISLGEKNGMDSEWKELFQEGGIAHILAISGLHITLIGMSLYRMLRRAGLPFAGASVFAAGIVFLYALMTGFGLSALRASLMFLIWLGAQVSGRRYDMVTAASMAAVVLLVRDAGSLQESSFLLSFSAVLVLAIAVPCGQRACGIQSLAGKSLFSCSAVWLGTLPVTLYFFYQTSPWSMLVNLAVIPLMSVIMGTGITAAAIGLISVPVGTFLAAPVHYLLHLFEWLCSLEQEFPLAVWVAGRPSWVRILGYYGIFAAMIGVSAVYLSIQRTKKNNSTGIRAHHIRMIWLLGAVLGVWLMTPVRPDRLMVTCLDVGQGDGTLVQLPTGETCLIDGGSTSESSVWKYRISQTVKYYGIGTLDYIFVSHADRDHISGITEFLKEYDEGIAGRNVHGITLENLVLPPTAEEEDFAELKALAAQNGVRVLTMACGDTINSAAGHDKAAAETVLSPSERTGRDSDGSKAETAALQGTGSNPVWSITCLAPEPDKLTGDRNEDSMVLMLQYGSFRMLFTGDLESRAEADLTDSAVDLHADVLKAGHHGSKASSSEAFLQKVSPEVTVISCGRGNSYGHPAPETLERLQNAGSTVFQTPLDGAVTVVSDGKTFSVEPFRSEKNR